MTILFICSIVEWLSNEQNFKDYIFPLISLVLTFLSAYWVSNHSFKKHIEKEKKEKEEDDENYRIFFEENLRKACNIILSDITHFNNVLNERYQIDKGIIPTPVLGVTKELDIVKAADLRKLEGIYNIRSKTPEDRNTFYSAINAINRQSNYYARIEREFNSINAFLKSFDIELLRRFETLMGDVSFRFIEKVKQQWAADPPNEPHNIKEEDINIFTNLLSSYTDNTNNYMQLKLVVENLETTEAFRAAIGPLDLKYTSNKMDFFMIYFKIEQEIGLHNGRIQHLLSGMAKHAEAIAKFLISTNETPELRRILETLENKTTDNE